MTKKKVIVVGGGFAGLQLVRHLDEKLFDILLIDKVNHHQFQPLFYQVATSQVEPSAISFPLRHVFKKKKNLQIRLAEVYAIDRTQKTIQTTIGTFEYDYLVLAMGGKTNFFGNEKIEKNAFTLKTTYDAITIRNHILEIFEKILSASEAEKEYLRNIVIVGGGPTGVELAGAFAEIKKHILPRDYKRIDFSKLKIILIEGSKYTLKSMSNLARKSSVDFLNRMGVELRMEEFVTDYDGNELILKSGKIIKTKTVIWSAGIIANIIPGIPKEVLGRGNRVKVNRQNRLMNEEAVFVLGDMAFMRTTKYPQGHPQLANVAINQAKLLAKNLRAMQYGKPLKEYEYKDLGAMATFGRNNAVVDLPFVNFSGFWAWLVWTFLHLMLILSTKNKLFIFIDWAWAYITKDTSLRLILKENKSAACREKQ
jgi:NADH dehydrogenase